MTGDTLTHPEDLDDSALPLCPGCMAENPAHNHFCEACGKPISWYAAIDPMGQIYSTGHMYREAIRKPTKPIILIGMWAIFFPTLLLFMFVFMNALYRLETGWVERYYPDIGVTYGSSSLPKGHLNSIYISVIAHLLLVAFYLIYAFILYDVTRNFFRHRREMRTNPEAV